MLPYDVAVFDLDGTLTESGIGIMNSVEYALGKMSVAMENSLLRKFIGPPLFESFRDLAKLSDEDARRAVAIYRERYSTIGWMENRAYTGIPRLLKSLKKHGCKLYVATGKPEKFTMLILEKFGLLQYFDGVSAITLQDEHADKAKLVKNALPKKFRRACMVGDRIFDMDGATANGIDGIGALYGYGCEEELLRGGAVKIAKDVDDLTEILLGEEKPEKGVFITLEGCDGCGKTTQKDLLTQWLRERGWEVVLSREPGGCAISEKIRDLLLDVKNRGMDDICEAMLFAAARAQHVGEVIRPAVERGAIVLCDRFVDSSVAYQGYARGLGTEQIQDINRPAIGDMMPGVTLYFALDPDTALTRRVNATQPDRIESEKIDFARRVGEGYEEIARKEPDRVARIDANGDKETVCDRAKQALQERCAL